jgi:opacity protein-like surface antigen
VYIPWGGETMKKIFTVLLLVFSTTAHAEIVLKKKVGKSDLQNPMVQSRKNLNQRAGVFMLGYDVRFERNQEQQTKDRSMLNYAGGIEWSPWIALLEYASFKEGTADGSVSVDRKVDTLFAWAYWQPTDLDLVAPFLGGGLGMIKTSVETGLASDSQTDQSPWQTGVGASFGIRFWPRSHVWLSAEGRLYKSPQLDPDPTLGGLIRLGFVIW